MDNAGFWERVDKGSEAGSCWLWRGAKDPGGYGRVRYCGKTMLAHRLAFFLANGELGPDECVCHRCDNPPCCNPAHLFVGSRLDNNRDMVSKGRHAATMRPGYHKIGEKHGCAKLTDRQAKEIAETYAKGGISQRKLADQYGVSQRTVAKIVLGIGWKHVIKPNAEAEEVC